jgi:hypothetical protein
MVTRERNTVTADGRMGRIEVTRSGRLHVAGDYDKLFLRFPQVAREVVFYR